MQLLRPQKKHWPYCDHSGHTKYKKLRNGELDSAVGVTPLNIILSENPADSESWMSRVLRAPSIYGRCPRQEAIRLPMPWWFWPDDVRLSEYETRGRRV